MKLENILRIGIFILILPGCVHQIGLNNEQSCASRGMVLDGVDVGFGSGVVTNGKTTYIANTSSENVRCARITSEAEKCSIEAYLASTHPRTDHDDYVGIKNIGLFVGYLYIVPGVLGYFYFDEIRKEAIEKSQSIQRNELAKCEALSH